MKRVKLVSVLVLVAFLSLSCASINAMLGIEAPKPYAEWTPKEKAYFFEKTYNDQYADYLAQYYNPKRTEAMSEGLKKKKEILGRFYPLVKLFSEAVDQGKPTDPVTEYAILQILAELQVKLSK